MGSDRRGMGQVISEQRLADIVWKSQGLIERIEASLEAAGGQQSTEDPVTATIDAWCDSVAGGDRERFEKRLLWSGISRSAIGVAVTSEAPPDLHEIPDWAIIMNEMICTVSTTRTEEEIEFLCEGEPIPFEHVLAPLVTWATGRWVASTPTDLFGPSSIVEAQRFLLQRLADRAAAALLHEFHAFARPRAGGGRPPGAVLGSDNYERFVESVTRGGWIELLEKYPVLARQIGAAVQFWIESQTELAMRLGDDIDLLEAEFGTGGPVGAVVQMQLDAGDPHVGGRSPVILRFEHGLRVVYKPRDIAAEATWFGLLAWLNERIERDPFRVLKVAERDGYGWVEFVDYRPLDDAGQGRIYYRRAGHLLCLAYVLGAVDCHFENLITSGVDPVLVDLETLLQPRPRRTRHENSKGRSPKSVMGTGFLPRWNSPAAAGRPLDLSALGCQSAQPTLYPERAWCHVNTDEMKFDNASMQLVPQFNRVFVDGSGLVLSQFEDSLLEGFQETYRWILAERDLWLSQPHPIARLRSCSIRILLRATASYGKIIHEGADPERLRDGVEWSLHADVVSSPWLGWDHPPPFWSALGDEHRAVIVGDVPRFGTTGGSEDLVLTSGLELRGCFKSSAYGDFLDRVTRLDVEDLDLQMDNIHRSIATWEMVRRGNSELDVYLAASLSPE